MPEAQTSSPVTGHGSSRRSKRLELSTTSTTTTTTNNNNKQP
jgi:hypothetical protein